jgi:hypothetical protein
MTVLIEPIARLTDRARHALIAELGVIDTMRFLHQFRAGGGNYTAERERLFKGQSVKDIVSGIKARRVRGET